MMRTIRMWRSRHWPAALLVLVTSVRAEDLRDWYCPYTPDGACTPKRQTYGYFAPKWRRWPGVTSADYESKRPPQEQPQPPAATEGSGLPPSELLLPPTNFRRDDAPAPPGGAGQQPPQAPNARPTPDILSPPGEDVMDELLPDVEAPKRPAEKPSQPKEADIPFPEAEEPDDSAPAPPKTEPATPEADRPEPAAPEPAAPQPTAPSDNDDPFHDDPFFDDAAPAPGDATQPNQLNQQLDLPSRPVPTTRDSPRRLPSAELGRTPQSRLSRTPGSAQPTSARLRPDVSRNVPRGNPLRAGAAPVLPDSDQVVPVAAWQSETDIEAPVGGGRNPLR